jgi:formylglycine-generating enzyme required for sulfatase activity
LGQRKIISKEMYQMPEHHAVDITEIATLGGQLPLRLMRLGFRLMQMIDEQGRDQYRYIVPPVCTVPAGPFLMGSDIHGDVETLYDEIPQQQIVLAGFQIGAYPVTVAEYVCAVEAGIVDEPQTVGNGIWQMQQKYPDHPVVCVTWHQAKAYAAWLAQITGERWRLPTEAEWEKAARGPDGRIYPWGDQWDKTRANTADDGPGMTTPVGNYPQGSSPYGACDMSGNVFEWTSSIYVGEGYQTEYSENDQEATSLRVLRGGSGDVEPEDARAARRFAYSPDDSNDDCGFRLASVQSSL